MFVLTIKILLKNGGKIHKNLHKKMLFCGNYFTGKVDI